MSAKPLKVAIVHDWLVGGGAELVVLELHRMFPEAPIYTSYCTSEWRQRLDGKVVTGWLQHWPFSKLRKYLPVLRIWWFTHLNLNGYDLVISSSGNGEAKGVKVSQGTKHICYCHSPTHFYWRHYDQYLRQPGFGLFNPLARLGLRLLVGPLRRWDYRAAQRPDYLIANSTHIQADIKQYYDRESVVIYPPIDVKRFANAAVNSKRQGFIAVGRQVPHKHTDIIIEACNKLGLPLTVSGRGPDHDRLVKLAGPTISFKYISDAEMPAEMANAQAFIFASYDDFGITPIEAMAAGTPVIAYQAGGALDYVIPGQTGQFFSEQTADSLIAALQTFQTDQFSTSTIQQYAQQFSANNFQTQLQQIVDRVVDEAAKPGRS